ncbi:MAG: Abi-alpha family protein [Thermodesulfobacteriota bacterium]
MDDKKSTGDLLGLAPYGEAINTLSKGIVAGAGAFLSKICLPAAEEFGLLLLDRVHAWRTRNVVDVLSRAEQILNSTRPNEDLQAHPRLVYSIIDQGSWTDTGELKNMWAGLLAASCCKDGRDDGNLIFTNILSQLSAPQARLLNFCCQKTKKKLLKSGLLLSHGITLSQHELIEITGVSDIHRLDREMDHLRSLGLIEGGFPGSGADKQLAAAIVPLSLALQLYAKFQGIADPIEKFYGMAPVEKSGVLGKLLKKPLRSFERRGNNCE